LEGLIDHCKTKSILLPQNVKSSGEMVLLSLMVEQWKNMD